MAKRFTATERWDKHWFRLLPPRLKCAWDYLNSRCDFIGLWEIDMDRLVFEIGEPVTMQELREQFEVEPYGEDKLFIPGYVPFQYGDKAGKLSSNNKLHQNVCEALKARSLPLPEIKIIKGPMPGRTRAGDGPKVKDKVKVKDKDKEKVRRRRAEFVGADPAIFGEKESA